MLYIIIKGKKEYLDTGIVERYNLKPGMRTPFTGYEILKDTKKEAVSKEKPSEETPDSTETEINETENIKEGEA